MATFCLTVHAAYRCRHSGYCCSAPWQIPVEPELLPLLRSHAETAVILDREHGESYSSSSMDPVNPADGIQRVSLSRRADDTCVFFEADRGRLCTIHRVAGPELLPSACRHFPRIVLSDSRGSFVTLSSFCPTAAAMLLEHVPLRVVEAPPSLLPAGRLEGLDATAVLPPLLRDGVLMDDEGYSAWEHAAIAVLDRDDLQVDDAIDIIADATASVRSWWPGAGALADHVAATFASVAPSVGPPAFAAARPLRMFAAAHLFGSWAAYQNGGIGGVVDAVKGAVSQLKREMASGSTFVDAARAADLVLRHTHDGADHAGA